MCLMSATDVNWTILPISIDQDQPADTPLGGIALPSPGR